MILLSLDLETSGLDRNSDRVIEVGAVLYSTNLGQSLVSQAYLVKSDVPITAEITKITGITQHMLNSFGLESEPALQILVSLIERCDAIVGQNIVEFDLPFVANWLARELPEHAGKLAKRIVIDTKTDLPGVQAKHLGYMAADAGFLNPFPHRALSDCLTVLKLISLHDGIQKATTFEDILARAQSPRVTIAAQVSRADKDLAKKRGYYWSSDRRVWHKTCKEMDLETEAKEAPFDIARIEPIPFH